MPAALVMPGVMPASFRDVLQIAGAHNVVAIEDGARLVPGDGHRHAFDDAGVDHVADRGAPEIVPEHPRRAGFLAGRPPGAAEVAARLIASRCSRPQTWNVSVARKRRSGSIDYLSSRRRRSK